MAYDMGKMVAEAVSAARTGNCTAMQKLLADILPTAKEFPFPDIQNVIEEYIRVIHEKRSLYGVLATTMELSYGITQSELAYIDKGRSHLAEETIPIIRALIDLCDSVKPASPDKRGIGDTSNELQGIGAEMAGYQNTDAPDIEHVGYGQTVTSSDSGIESSGRSSVNGRNFGSRENVNRGIDHGGVARFFMDLDSALLAMDENLIPLSIPIIMGEIKDYPKDIVDVFENEYDGPARLFIHFGLIFVRRHGGPIHSAVSGDLVYSLCTALNKDLPAQEFEPQGELLKKYVNRHGCGYLVPKKSDGGIGFSTTSKHFREEEHFVAVEVAVQHENLLGFYSEAAVYLGPRTHIGLFVGARVSFSTVFWIKIYIIRKKPQPKGKDAISGISKEKCVIPLKQASAMVGNVMVDNDELEEWITERVNEVFDIDVVQIFDATSNDFDANGSLLRPDRFILELQLEIGPDDVRSYRLRFDGTVVRAYNAWRSYRRGLAAPAVEAMEP